MQFDTAELAALYNTGQHDILRAQMLAILRHLETHPMTEISQDMQAGFDGIAELFLQVLSAPNFVIPVTEAQQWIPLNTTLANMIRLTPYYNADEEVMWIAEQSENLVRLLLLYSPYCRMRFPLAMLFEFEPYLLSLWVATILDSRWKGHPETHAFIEEVMADPALAAFWLESVHFPVTEKTYFAYFNATYASPGKDGPLRDRINEQVKALFTEEVPIGRNRRRILVISANMNREHSVYRCLAPLLRSLKPEYHLALFHMQPEERGTLDRELFDEIHDMRSAGGLEGEFTYPMLRQILAGDYGVALFTDVGLNRPSLVLANLRLAEVQISTYGHPVTTGHSKIDFFIGGEAVEQPENPQRHYVEKLRLMPGLGVEPVPIPERPRGLRKEQSGIIEVGLSWGEQKVDAQHLGRLQKIQRQSKVPLRYRFLGLNANRLSLLAAKADLEDVFGGPEKVVVTPFVPRAHYLEELEKSDLLFDSHPFGSYNRVVDALAFGVPLLTLMGEKAYSRFAGALLRQAGLPELVTESEADFIARGIALVEDEATRNAIRKKIAETDLDKTLFHTGNAAAFRALVDSLI